MKKLPVISAAISILILAASCNLNNNDNTNPQQAYFLIANISPDAPALSLNINNSPFVTGFSYGIYTPYYSTNAGSYQFDLYGTGSSPVLSTTVNMEATKVYSYFVIDSFSKLKAAFVEDNLTAPSADSIYVRFFNFSPNSTAVSLFDSVNNIDWYTFRTFNDQAANSSYAIYTRKPAGIYTFLLKDPGGSILARKVDTLLGGHIFSIFAKGNIGGASPQDIGIGQVQNY